MPFKSKKQLRKCYAMKNKGKAGSWNCDEWAAETDESKLPEKIAAITLDINKGDILLGGRFKNVKTIVEEIGRDKLGQPTVNGKKLLAFRINKKLPADMQKEAQLNLEKIVEEAFIDELQKIAGGGKAAYVSTGKFSNMTPAQMDSTLTAARPSSSGSSSASVQPVSNTSRLSIVNGGMSSADSSAYSRMNSMMSRSRLK